MMVKSGKSEKSKRRTNRIAVPVFFGFAINRILSILSILSIFEFLSVLFQ
jgi:hypothetical protein